MSQIASGATAQTGYTTPVRSDDPYIYQVGFGNSFASEALPGVLPQGQNHPQKVKYDLYPEVITGTLFVTPRAHNQRTYLYRIQPSVVHNGFNSTPHNNPLLVSDFSMSNQNVRATPIKSIWNTFELPKEGSKVDFISGLKTFGGLGDPMSREGVAIHIYTANASMGKKAFQNSDGDLLIIPQQGRLDIQTELGRLMVRPGEIAVVQRAIKFKVDLPDGPSRGYVQELYGTHYELPELGPLGSTGLANVRDFEHPVASFDLDQSPWELVNKMNGNLYVGKQDHTPFDVVAWHGTYVPYKYDLNNFIAYGTINKDHADPSINVVLTARSKALGVAITDFCCFNERWDVATNTLRAPFYHRNVSPEFVGIVRGENAILGDLRPGGVDFQTSFVPHGPSPENFEFASNMELVPTKIYEDITFILFETAGTMSLTDYALSRPGRKEFDQKSGHDLKPAFLKHVNQVNSDLRSAGRRELGQ